MSDIFDEIDEEVRRDKMTAWWKKNVVFVIITCVLTVGGVAGYKFWQNHQVKAAQEVGGVYYEALKKLNSDKGDLSALDGVIAKYPDGVGLLAQFVKAQELAKTGKVDEAVALYERIASSAKDTTFKHLALVRAGYLMIDTASYKDLEAKFAALNTGSNPWQSNVREILGMSAWRNGEMNKAHELFNLILADRTASPYITQRAQNMAALIAPSLK